MQLSFNAEFFYCLFLQMSTSQEIPSANFSFILWKVWKVKLMQSLGDFTPEQLEQ